jgi:GNAT superfamily N-acetyltransferase
VTSHAPRPVDESYVSDRVRDDGTRVRLRLLDRRERAALARAFQQLSPESRYRRFFNAMPRLPESLLDALTATDGRDHVAVAAELLDDDGHAVEGLGVARFVRLKDKPEYAEAAVAVIDRMHRHGLGRMLLSVLARAARERGIVKFRAHVQADNEASKALLHTFAEHPDVHFDDGALVYDVDLPRAPIEETPDSALYRLFKLAAHELRVVFGAVLGEAGETPHGDTLRTPDKTSRS